MPYRRFGRHLLHGHTLPPHLSDYAAGNEKWWKGWSRVNGRTVEHISPYQQKIVSPLFRNPIGKLQHKVLDNLFIVPAFLLYATVVWWAPKRAKEIDKEEWP